MFEIPPYLSKNSFFSEFEVPPGAIFGLLVQKCALNSVFLGFGDMLAAKNIAFFKSGMGPSSWKNAIFLCSENTREASRKHF